MLAGDPDAQAKAEAIRQLTDQAMSGELDFGEALRTRLAMLRPTREQVAEAAERLAGMVTPSFARNRAFFDDNPGRVFVISGGFHEVVEPVVAAFGIVPSRCWPTGWTSAPTAGPQASIRPIRWRSAGGKVEAVRNSA